MQNIGTTIPRLSKTSGTTRWLSTSCVASSSKPKIAPLPHRSVIEISGPDAPKFLKGLTCKDVDALEGGYSGFLNASGRVLHTNFIFPLRSTAATKFTHPTYLITHDSPPDHPTPLDTFLPPFKLRSKVKIKDVTAQWSAWASWGYDSTEEGRTPNRTWKLGSGGAAESQWSWPDGVRSLELGKEEVGCWDLRAGTVGLGKQLLIPRNTEPTFLASHAEASTEDYHFNRTILGIPEGPQEIIPATALPLESCMDIQGGVDFRKGCYLGQELTVRTYHTGATRKRLLPIRLIPLDPESRTKPLISFLPPSNSTPSSSLTLPIKAGGSDITFYPEISSASRKPKSAGKILSFRSHPTVGTVGIGMVRTEMASKAWWVDDGSNAKNEGKTVGEWWDGDLARMGTSIGGVEYGVWVGEGEAWGAARQEIRRVEREKAGL